MNPHDPQWSYQMHLAMKNHDLPAIIAEPDTIDAWRHARMLDCALVLDSLYPKATWMTVGDGNYGSDAIYLQNKGVDVTATSLNAESLLSAKKQGLLDKIEAVNAEQIQFKDGSFDFVVCKEAYHHFPRPAIAFYDMLRVCKRALILIEPQQSTWKPFTYLKDLFKVFIRKDKSTLFEVSGNFIFRVNLPEIKKMMTALNYTCVAVKPINDFYHPRLCHRNMDKAKWARRVVKLGILIQDVLSRLLLLESGLVCIVVFKGKPDPKVVSGLSACGFSVHTLPLNPYI